MKKFIRKLINKLHYATNRWAIPNRVHIFIQLGNYSDAERELRKARRIYGKDPEVARLMSHIQFLKCPKG